MDLTRALNYADRKVVQGPLALRDVLEILSEFGIRHVPEIRDRENETEDVGLCDPNEMMIEISARQTRAEKYDSLIHELIHARDFIYGFKSPEVLTRQRTSQTYELIFGRKQNARIK